MERWIAQCCPAWWLANIVTNYKAAAVPLLQLASPSPSQTHSLQVPLVQAAPYIAISASPTWLLVSLDYFVIFT